MEVKRINPTATATFKVKAQGGGEETITFKVRMLGLHEIPDYVPKAEKGVKLRQSKIITEALIDTVLGWDITLDGQPIECNEANRREWLPYLLGLKVIREDEGQRDKFSLDDILGMALLYFAGDPENFLKN